MEVIGLSAIYGITASYLRGNFSILMAALLFVVVLGFGIHFSDLSVLLSVKALIAAWLSLNVGFALRILTPVFWSILFSNHKSA